MTGTSAKVPVNTIIKGFVDEDVPLALQAAAPAPLAVGVAPVPVPVPPPAATTGVTTAKPGDHL
jgi:hypothetical protein